MLTWSVPPPVTRPQALCPSALHGGLLRSWAGHLVHNVLSNFKFRPVNSFDILGKYLLLLEAFHESQVASASTILLNMPTTAYQAPPSMGFSRQAYWSGVPLPSPTSSYCTAFKGAASSESQTLDQPVPNAAAGTA